MTHWDSDAFIAICKSTVRAVGAPFFVPAEDRAVVIGLWLILWAAAGATVLLINHQIWVGVAATGILTLPLLIVLGNWGD